MKIIRTDLDQATIQFSRDEFKALSNTLNEVLNAFGWDFGDTGWTQDQARKLHFAIVDYCRRNAGESLIYGFTKPEIIFLIAAMNVTIAELPNSYSTRLGYTIEETPHKVFVAVNA